MSSGSRPLLPKEGVPFSQRKGAIFWPSLQRAAMYYILYSMYYIGTAVGSQMSKTNVWLLGMGAGEG